MKILLNTYAFLMYFIIVFALTYGVKNSGLIYGRLALVLIYFHTVILFFYFMFNRNVIERSHFLSLAIVVLSSFGVLLVNLEAPEFYTSFINFILITVSFWIISLLYRDNEMFILFLKWNIYISIAAVLLGFYLYSNTHFTLLGMEFEYDLFFSKRMNSWFNNSTVLGEYIALSLVSLFYLQKTNECTTVFFLLVSCLFVAGLILSGGRTGFLMLIIGLMVYSFNFSLKKSIKYFLLLTMFVVILVFVVVQFQDDVYFFRRLLSKDITELGGRGDKYDFFLRNWGEQGLLKLLFGEGVNSLSVLYGVSIHSGILRVFFEFGMIPAVIFYFILLRYVMVAVKYFEHEYFAKTAKLIAALLIMLFLSELMTITLWGVAIFYLYFWVFIAQLTTIKKKALQIKD